MRYSKDFRERVLSIKAEEGLSIRKTAQRFGVGQTTLLRWVAYAGLNPSIHQSGSSVNRRGHLSKTGSKALRKVFYIPAVSAKNICKCYKPFVQRLQDKGKPPKVILIAVMHKLFRIVFAVLKKGRPFDQTLLNQT